MHALCAVRLSPVQCPVVVPQAEDWSLQSLLKKTLPEKELIHIVTRPDRRVKTELPPFIGHAPEHTPIHARIRDRRSAIVDVCGDLAAHEEEERAAYCEALGGLAPAWETEQRVGLHLLGVMTNALGSHAPPEKTSTRAAGFTRGCADSLSSNKSSMSKEKVADVELSSPGGSP
jgi:hypothetical protein